MTTLSTTSNFTTKEPHIIQRLLLTDTERLLVHDTATSRNHRIYLVLVTTTTILPIRPLFYAAECTNDRSPTILLHILCFIMSSRPNGIASFMDRRYHHQLLHGPPLCAPPPTSTEQRPPVPIGLRVVMR
jgi:hypothetical protein